MSINLNLSFARSRKGKLNTESGRVNKSGLLGKKSFSKLSKLNSVKKKRKGRKNNDRVDTDNISEENKESERTRMNNKFHMLYIPKNYLCMNRDKAAQGARQLFTRFSSLDGITKFVNEKNLNCPSNTIRGLKNRLRHNRSAQNLYIEHYNKKHKKALSMAVGKLELWKSRNRNMPRVLSKPNYQSMVAGNVGGAGKSNGKISLDDSVNLEPRKPIFNSGMFTFKKRKKKNFFLKKSTKKDELIKSMKKYSKKIRLRNLLRKSGEKSMVVKKEEREKMLEVKQREKYIREYNFAWYKSEQTNPVLSREGSTFNYFNGKGWLIGGIGETILKEILMYDFSKQEFKELEGVKEDIGVPRFNHTTAVYKSKFYLFGGEIFNNFEFRSRRVLNDIKIFDPSLKNWETLSVNGDYVSPRRNHTAVSVGKMMFVNGGLNQNGDVLNDTWSFNFETKTWSGIFVQRSPPHLSHHAACAVFSNSDRVNDLSVKPKGKEKNFPDEGIYFFGGKNSERKPTNKLVLLNIFSKPPSYSEPSTVGQTPAPRFGHCMHFYPPKKILIVYGGRNDEMYQLYGKCSYNDIHVLNLKYMGWCRVNTGHITPGGRCFFSSFSIDSKIFVFGGLRECNYVSGTTHCLELDETLSYRLRQNQKAEKELEEYEKKNFYDDREDGESLSITEFKPSPIPKIENFPKGFSNLEQEKKMEDLNVKQEETEFEVFKGFKKSSTAFLDAIKVNKNEGKGKKRKLEETKSSDDFTSYQPLPRAFSLVN